MVSGHTDYGLPRAARSVTQYEEEELKKLPFSRTTPHPRDILDQAAGSLHANGGAKVRKWRSKTAALGHYPTLPGSGCQAANVSEPAAV